MSKTDACIVKITSSAAAAAANWRYRVKEKISKVKEKIKTFATKKTSGRPGAACPLGSAQQTGYCVILSMRCVKTDVLQGMPPAARTDGVG